MLEKERPERKGRADILKAGLIIGALATPYEHGPVQAAEIQQSASWQQGVSELERSAKEEPDEYGADIVIYADGSTDWLPMSRGSASSVAKDTNGLVNIIATYARGRKIEKICDAHTHPVKTITKAFGVPLGSKYAPPSGMDMDVLSGAGWSFQFDKHKELGLDHADVFSVVFDGAGAWYHRLATDDDTRRNKEFWSEIQRGRDTLERVRALSKPFETGLPSLPLEILEQAKNLLSTEDQRGLRLSKEINPAEYPNHLAADLARSFKANPELRDTLQSILGAALDPVSWNELRSVLTEFDTFKSKRDAEMAGIQAAQRAFVERGASPDFNFSLEYPKLQEAYLRGSQTVVRFVPYQELENEPPCAGPDYKPPKE